MKFVLAAAAFGLIAGSASAATLVNGGFEQDPGVAGYAGSSYGSMNWDTWEKLPGWNGEYKQGGKGIEVQTAATLGLTPAEGSHYVELDSASNSSMWQDVALAAGNYVLSFMYAPRIDSDWTNGIEVKIKDMAQPKNTLAYDFVNGPSAEYPLMNWTKVNLAFTIPTYGTYTVYFGAVTGSDGLGGLIDDVKLSAVPVPAAGLMLMGALGGLAALRRRKQA